MTKKIKKQFSNINFELQSNRNCCGIIDVGSFYYSEGYWDWSRRKKVEAEKFETEKQQLEELTKRYKEELTNHITDGNNYKGSYLIQASIVSKYRVKHPDQNLYETIGSWLQSMGFTSTRVFTNQNTGNEVTIYERLISYDEIVGLLDETGKSFHDDYDDESEEDY